MISSSLNCSSSSSSGSSSWEKEDDRAGEGEGEREKGTHSPGEHEQQLLQSFKKEFLLLTF